MVRLRVNLPQLDTILHRLEAREMVGPPLRDALADAADAMRKDAALHQPHGKGVAIGPITTEVDRRDPPTYAKISVGSQGYRVAQALNFAKVRYHYRAGPYRGRTTRGWFTGAKSRQRKTILGLFERALDRMATWRR